LQILTEICDRLSQKEQVNGSHKTISGLTVLIEVIVEGFYHGAVKVCSEISKVSEQRTVSLFREAESSSEGC